MFRVPNSYGSSSAGIGLDSHLEMGLEIPFSSYPKTVLAFWPGIDLLPFAFRQLPQLSNVSSNSCIVLSEKEFQYILWGGKIVRKQ